jgi:uncharacterized protein YdhG (YjbR/CyaY superfamily)
MDESKWKIYLAKQDRAKAELIVKYLMFAHKYARGAVAEMPYGIPGLKLGGKGLIAIATHKDHLGIYPFSPNVVREVKAKIVGAEFAEGTIRFDYSRLPSEEEIKLIVESRIAEIT